MTTPAPTNLFAPKPESQENDGHITFKLPRATKDKFLALCKSHKLEMSEVLRRFIDSQLAK